jgi:translation initiation factor IF-2
MAGKPTRINQLAAECNISVDTIIQHLAANGFKGDEFTATKKLDSAQVDMITAQFASDHAQKEEAKKVSHRRPERHESISLEDGREETKTEVKINVPEVVIEVKETVAPVAIVDVVETPIVVVETPVVPEVVIVEATGPVVDDNESKTIGTGDRQVNVIGTIDLDSLNLKSRPDKQKKDFKKDNPVKAKGQNQGQNQAPAKPAYVAPAVKAPVVATPVAPPIPAVVVPIETIRVQSQTLSGPTVIGKIELPAERQKAASSRPGEESRKKRKRIPGAPGSNPNAGGNAAGGARPPFVPGQPRPPFVPGQGRPAGTGYQGGNKFGNKPNPNAPKVVATPQDISKEVKDTLARLSGAGAKSKGSKNRKAKRQFGADRREQEMADAEMQEKILKLTEFVTVSELASMMSVHPTKIISACMSLGIFASINQRLDAETIQIIAIEFGFETEFVSAEVQEAIAVVEDKEEDLVPRPPIITVMGHVDHGKTSLLDRIRNENIMASEAGGITQHIGAYSVTLKDGKALTFLDTPGHEAFTAMRARGAQVTDIAVILVAADDDVMPQTKEAIAHAQAANVPMIFAINKIDKAGANTDRIREQLSAMNILVEEWGGKYQCQEISAKQGLNIDALLEKIILEAEMLDLKANPAKNAVGTVIESTLDKGKGYVTNMLVEAGTLRVGDIVLVGRYYGRVRAMHNEKGEALSEAGPSVPVAILGIGGAPSAGDRFNIMNDEREARNIATKREQLYREQGLRTTKHITLDEIGRRLAIGDFKELNLIVKGDVDGSIEALSDALLGLSTEEIAIRIVHKGVGQINEADINLASASDAIIIGFQVRPSVGARKLADTEQIDIRLYSVIYKAIDEIKAAMEGMLSPDIEEKITGSAEVRETFDITRVGTIAGCYVLEGIIKRNNKIRVIRDGVVQHTGTLGSLKRFKDDVKEVKNNYECGLNIDKYDDIKTGDIIEAFEEMEVARKL